MKSFSPVQVENWELQRVHDAIAASLNPIAALPILDGLLLEGVELKAAQANAVSHGLGRKPRLWIVVNKNANANVWEQASDAPTRILNLHTSADCTVSLWVA